MTRIHDADNPVVPCRTLGRTGLKVPLVALGTGGPERLGQAKGRSVDEVSSFLRSAIELGINYFDTAPDYDESESLIGECLREIDRNSYLLATKFRPYFPDGSVKPESALAKSVSESLRRLQVDHVDLLQLHGVEPHHYREVADRFVPELYKLQSRGITRFLGITEKPVVDPWHETLKLALIDDAFDTVMVGYSILNPTAAGDVIPKAAAQNVGVIGMVAVQGVSRWPEIIERAVVRDPKLAQRCAHILRGVDPLVWLLGDAGLPLSEIGYRFVAGTAGVSTVLTGTSNIDHLHANAAAVAEGALPGALRDRIDLLFGEAAIQSIA